MDPHLVHGDPPVRNESWVPSSSRALETRQQRPRPTSRVFRLRQPAGAAGCCCYDSGTTSTWYTQPAVILGHGIGSVTVAHEPEAWRTRPWHPGLEFGWVWAWSLGLVAERPDQPQSKERKG